MASPGSELRTTSTPSPRVDLADLVGEGQRPRIEDVGDAERLEEVPLLRAAGRGEDLRPDALADLQCRQTDAARAGVDQHPFAGGDAAQHVQGVVGREEGDRDGRRFLEADVFRLADHGRGRSGRVRGEAERRHADRLVADGQVGHALADRGHDAGALDAERHGAGLEAGVEAHRLEHVAEVQARRPHLDFHLAGAGRPPPRRPQRQAVQRALARQFQAVRLAATARPAGRRPWPARRTSWPARAPVAGRSAARRARRV